MSAFGAAAQVGMFPTIPVRGITPDVVLFNLPRPPSVWKSTNKSIYAQLLAQGEFDVLVVPCQVEHYALSRSTRSLITARLAAAVAATGRYRVPDPHLVARALGDGERRIHPEEVYALAHKLGVRRIVRTLAGGIDFSLLFERALHPAQGTAGGGAGRPAQFHIRRADGSRLPLRSKTPLGRLEAGDALHMETAGGGGWGTARSRG